MRRLVLLLLIAAPVLAWAGTSESDPASKRGACEYVSSSSVDDDAPAVAPQARAPIPSASRSGGKPSAASSAGGGDADVALPRSRSSKWHSFLPGMFR